MSEHVRRFDYLPWEYLDEEVPEEHRAVQQERQRAVGGDTVIGERCYVAESAAVFTPTVRAHCDAVEIADLLLGATPPQLTAAEHRRRLARRQDPGTGLVSEIGAKPAAPGGDGFPESGSALYHVLSVGHALDLLGAGFPYPVRGVAEMAPPNSSHASRACPGGTTRGRPGRGSTPGPRRRTGTGGDRLGTEMWLAIVWYLADLLGRSDTLGYRPRGVHRPARQRATPGSVSSVDEPAANAVRPGGSPGCAS